MNPLRNLWGWFETQFVGEVPPNDALCEFDCRQPQCHEEEWESCARRLQRAAGELMPAKQPTSKVVAVSTPAVDVILRNLNRV